MKKNKIIFIIIFFVLLFFTFRYYQGQKIENKEEKIMQAYQLLDVSLKHWIKDKDNISSRSDIKKIKLRENNTKYIGENKDFFGKTVYEVTFPLEDGRPETEFWVLYNLELTEIVGYGALD